MKIFENVICLKIGDELNSSCIMIFHIDLVLDLNPLDLSLSTDNHHIEAFLTAVPQVSVRSSIKGNV